MTSVPPATLEPIVHEYRLPCPVDEAFDTYVRRIGEWWPANYSASPATFTGVTIKPSVVGSTLRSATEARTTGER